MPEKNSEIFNDLLIENPIIGAIRNDTQLKRILKSNLNIVFLLYGTVLSIPGIVKKLTDSGKIVFIHLDMIDGLKNDEAGICYVKEKTSTYGIITTRPNSVKYAKEQSLYTILRLFIIDSKSLATGIKNAEEYKPDAIEVMPGASSKIINTVLKSIKLPIIAGGLIDTKEEVITSIRSGAIAISTGSENIWTM